MDIKLKSWQALMVIPLMLVFFLIGSYTGKQDLINETKVVGEYRIFYGHSNENGLCGDKTKSYDNKGYFYYAEKKEYGILWDKWGDVMRCNESREEFESTLQKHERKSGTTYYQIVESLGTQLDLVEVNE